MSYEWIHMIDDKGITPLDRAFNSGHMAIAELMLRQERLDKEEFENGLHRPLDRAAYFGLYRALEVLLHTTNPDLRDRHGETALHKAVRGGNEQTTALLVDACDVNARSCDGMTALHWACLRGNLEIARMLLSANADPHMRNESLDGLTPKNLARLMGHQELTELLSAREAFV